VLSVSDTRVLVTGAGGQLGRALVASAPPGVEVVAANHAELDVGAADAVAAYVARVAPQVVINAAGYTAVDAAESDADGALRVNGAGVRHLARALRERSGARLVQVSTDYVFDGRASSPYAPEAEPAPLGAYGASKLAGERAASEELGARAAIVRSAWIYSAVGRNFFLTMLRLLEQRGEVAVVADQVGTPTSAGSLATALWRCAVLPVSGVLHWTDAGVASWYDFAVAIAEEAAAKGLVRRDVVVRPIATVDYPTAARRPAYSVLDKRSATASLGIEPRHWRVELRAVIAEYADA
jgi:dTDP-4-dehydrorhamnose reductase